MRYDRARGRTAAEILNQDSEADLADLLYEYGEERRSRRLARAIVNHRSAKPFARTGELVRVIEQTIGGRRGRIHPATRAFQALRIAVNDELESLREALAGAASILRLEGRLVVISFHSLEDRIVKRFVAERRTALTEPRLHPLVRKPLTPTRGEIERNVRARSAKLRVAERISLDQAA
jgi:16S rRNA (cytosine1402-N4)-methyltransferase